MHTYSIDKIIVPVDFTDLSLDALHTAASLAKRLSAEIVLLHVIENYFLLSTPEAGIPSDLNIADMQAKSRQNLEEIAERFRQEYTADIRVKTDFGLAGSRIIRHTLEEEAGLIVMGTHGASGFREFFIGSNAYSVVKQAPCPVLTIPAGAKKVKFSKILFPIRLIPKALEKYETARPFFSRKETHLNIIGLNKTKDIEDINSLNNMMETLQDRVEQDGIEVSSEMVVSSDIPSEVIKRAESKNYDLVVITATLDQTFKEFFIGPYTQQIVNHCKVPVLSIKPLPEPGQLQDLRMLIQKQENNNPPLAVGFG